MDKIAKDSRGLFGFNFDTLDNITRAISFNSPLAKALILGGTGFIAAKKAAPVLSSILSPSLRSTDRTFYDMPKAEQKSLSNLLGLTTAAALALPTVVNNFDKDSPWFGLKQFPEKQSYNDFMSSLKKIFLNKQSNGLGFNPYDPMQAIPLSTAKDTILSHPTLTPMTKATSLGILNTFPTNTQVTGKNIIDRAVSTGIDFLKGGAFGAITAYALGLPNPYSTAAITGTLNAIF